MRMNMSAFNDPFIRIAADIKCPMGMTPHDAAKLQPGKSIARTFEQVDDTEQREYPTSSEMILAQGAAVGLDDDGIAVHFFPGRTNRFIGFLIGSNEARATVKSRGSIVLKIENATLKDIGKPIFCSGPNSFSLHKSAGAAEIGAIRHVEGNGLSSITFRPTGDKKPLNLNVKNTH